MNAVPIIVIIALFVLSTTLKHYAAARRSKERVPRNNLDSKAASRKAFIEEYRRKQETRPEIFIQQGLRPLQIALWISLAVYVLSMAAAVICYWQQVELWRWLIMPAFLLVIWSMSSSYARSEFSVNGFVTAFTLLFEYRHLMDPFWVTGALGRIMVLVFAFIIYAKMKDPIFSRARATSQKK
jgi:hypothetical protein